MRRIAVLLLSILAVGTGHAGERFITLSSTTSTQDSGLFDHILPIFRSALGVSVHVVAVGTGQALAIAARSDADALLVHDRVGEDKFVADGYGIDRWDVMYNDFVIVGPGSDPAGSMPWPRSRYHALCGSGRMPADFHSRSSIRLVPLSSPRLADTAWGRR
jgi:tungstate transport system substrate-binding protein